MLSQVKKAMAHIVMVVVYIGLSATPVDVQAFIRDASQDFLLLMVKYCGHAVAYAYYLLDLTCVGSSL